MSISVWRARTQHVLCRMCRKQVEKKSFLFYALERPKSRKFQFSEKNLDLPLYKIEISGIIIIVRCASVAQSVEQGTENPRVIGSIPIGGTSQGNPAGFPICGRSSSGRAPPCQGGGSEFEPRRPLQYEAIVDAEMQKRWLFCFVWQWSRMLSDCQSKEPPYNTMHGGSSYNINIA